MYNLVEICSPFMP